MPTHPAAPGQGTDHHDRQPVHPHGPGRPAAVHPAEVDPAEVEEAGEPQTEPKSAQETPSDTGSTGSDKSDSGQSTASGQVIADLPAQSTKQFSMVGVTWLPGRAGANTADVQVRTRPVNGTWSDWSTLDSDTDGNQAGANRSAPRRRTSGRATRCRSR